MCCAIQQCWYFSLGLMPFSTFVRQVVCCNGDAFRLLDANLNRPKTLKICTTELFIAAVSNLLVH